MVDSKMVLFGQTLGYALSRIVMSLGLKGVLDIFGRSELPKDKLLPDTK